VGNRGRVGMVIRWHSLASLRRNPGNRHRIPGIICIWNQIPLSPQAPRRRMGWNLSPIRPAFLSIRARHARRPLGSAGERTGTSLVCVADECLGPAGLPFKGDDRGTLYIRYFRRHAAGTRDGACFCLRQPADHALAAIPILTAARMKASVQVLFCLFF